MSDERRKVCVVLVDRANYGRLKPVMTAIRERPELQLQVIAAGTMVVHTLGPLTEVAAQHPPPGPPRSPCPL